MRRFSWSAIALGGIAVVALLSADGGVNGTTARADDKVVGTRYQFTAVNGDKEDKSTFRVYKYEVFRKDKKIGTIKPKSDAGDDP